jgi:glycosyltransferase involved in cell wall biosynthesis
VRQRIPTLVSLRGGDVPGFLPELDRVHALLTPIRRHCLRNARAVVANSPSLADLARAADGGEVRVIVNGVDTETFFPAERSEGRAFELIFVGRLTAQKRLGMVMEAFERLCGESAGTEAPRLSIVGDGPLREALEARARRLGIAGRVTWHGWVSRDRLGELYRGAHALVQASNIEGMSNTALEAMASGLPVIASDGPGNRDVVADRRNGLLFAVDDREALMNAMRLLHTDRALAARLGHEARAMALSRHSWEASARAYLGLFDLPGKSATAPASAPTSA